MPGNSIGHIFRLNTFGESHGTAIGGIIDGCPAGLQLDFEYIQNELNRRRPGQSSVTSQRNEADKVEFLSGIFEEITTGTPIAFIIYNKDQQSSDYDHLRNAYRPSHADYTYDKKYGIRDFRGGGRASARETAARVVGGAIAKLFLTKAGINITAFVSQIGHIVTDIDTDKIESKKIEASLVRCPDPVKSKKMETLINKLKKEGDTIGGAIKCIIDGMQVGLGDPIFDKLHADLAKAIMSINAVKGFEYGSGFKSATMRGSEHNDKFISSGNGITTETNFSGGIQGGISNGQNIYFRVAFKPIATVISDQETVDKNGQKTIIKGKGRHDVCVVPRAVPIVESMAAIVLVDHYLRNKIAKI
ncbi:MAG: chorismate synthase [Bacteroidales bacterium]|nr:chorismate synthase [Bacteroidales bacterium]